MSVQHLFRVRDSARWENGEEKKKSMSSLGMRAQTTNPSAWKTEAGRSLKSAKPIE